MKYIQRLAQHMRVVASTWSRVLVMIWKTNPWYVTWLLVFTFLGGLSPSLQIQLTSQIIQNAAEAIQGGHALQLVHLAILFGFLQGGLMLVSSVLGIGQQQLQSLLQTKLANAIAIQIMEKAIFQYLTTNAHSVKEIRLFRLGDHFLGRYKQLYNNVKLLKMGRTRRLWLSMAHMRICSSCRRLDT